MSQHFYISQNLLGHDPTYGKRGFQTTSTTKGSLKTFQAAFFTSPQLRANPIFHAIQHGGEFLYIGAAGLCQIWSAAAFAADLFGCEFDQIAGFHFSGQGFGYAGAQGDFAVVHCRQKNHGVVGFAG